MGGLSRGWGALGTLSGPGEAWGVSRAGGLRGRCQRLGRQAGGCQRLGRSGWAVSEAGVSGAGRGSGRAAPPCGCGCGRPMRLSALPLPQHGRLPDQRRHRLRARGRAHRPAAPRHGRRPHLQVSAAAPPGPHPGVQLGPFSLAPWGPIDPDPGRGGQLGPDPGTGRPHAAQSIPPGAASPGMLGTERGTAGLFLAPVGEQLTQQSGAGGFRAAVRGAGV